MAGINLLSLTLTPISEGRPIELENFFREKITLAILHPVDVIGILDNPTIGNLDSIGRAIPLKIIRA